jgi:hypothetical protein
MCGWMCGGGCACSALQTKKELSEEITHLGDTISEKAEKLQFDFLNLFSRKGVLVIRESPLLS